MHGQTAILTDIVVFLVIAGLIVPVMQRLRVSPVLGFIVVGVVVGPHGLGQLAATWPLLSSLTIEDTGGVRVLAEFGIVFLLFMIGLELSLDRLASMRRLVFGLGGLQIVVTGAIIAGFALLFGNAVPASIVIGASLALSSTAIVTQLLITSRRFSSPTGQVSFAILLMQDLAVVPILFLAGALASEGGEHLATGLGLALAKAALIIGLIIVVGRIVVRPVFRFVVSTNSREFFMAIVLLTIIATAVATEMAGLSLALGAFLAGLLLSETEYRHQVEVDIDPFKGLLLGLFFMSVGMSLDLSALAAEPLWIPLSVAGLIVIKLAVLFVLARLFQIVRPVALESAILLAQGGEFAFVVLSLALTLGLIDPAAQQFMLLVTILSMLNTPLMARLGRLIAAREELKRPAQVIPPDMALNGEPIAGPISGHVIIAGYGRVGRMLGEMLDAQRAPHVGLDIEIGAVTRSREEGCNVYFGDAAQADILTAVHIDSASALVVTMDDHTGAEKIIAAVHARWPNLPIVARARDRVHARRLLGGGATAVVPETTEASLDLAEVVLEKLGIDAETARRIVDDRRQVERAALAADR